MPTKGTNVVTARFIRRCWYRFVHVQEIGGARPLCGRAPKANTAPPWPEAECPHCRRELERRVRIGQVVRFVDQLVEASA